MSVEKYPKDGTLDIMLHLKYPDGVAPVGELTDFLDKWEQAKQDAAALTPPGDDG